MCTYICIWIRYLQKHLGLKGKKVDDYGIKKRKFSLYTLFRLEFWTMKTSNLFKN